MKMAIIHDQLLIKGGAERVFLAMAQAFPDAALYTLAYNPKGTYEEFKELKIGTTFINSVVRTNTAFRYLFPVNIFAIQTLKLQGYDLVLSSSATVAKYVRIPHGRHFCFCYFPTRAIWHGDKYFSGSIMDQAKRAVTWALRRLDYAAAQRVDRFIAQSETTRKAIEDYYDRKADIIASPIDLERFQKPAREEDKGSHFLIVSRLETWKVLDYAIEAFNRLELPLIIIGEGAEENRLHNIAGPTIAFMGAVDDDELAKQYANAKAVIFTPELEYGLVPLEANASGTPVIAYGVGGVCETMVPWCDDDPESAKKATALFFEAQTADSLMAAVRRFNQISFRRDAIIANSACYSVEIFQEKLRDYVRKFGASDA